MLVTTEVAISGSKVKVPQEHALLKNTTDFSQSVVAK